MNCTPFALITLLCTLATSMVAAGNASRRAGADHAVTKPTTGEIALTGYLLTFELPKPAIEEEGWYSIDLNRMRDNLVAKLPGIIAKAQKAQAAAGAKQAKPAVVAKA